MGKKQGVYIFCAIPDGRSLKLGKITFDHQERDLFTIPYKDCSMVVTNTPLKIIRPIKENLIAHQNTISQIMNDYAVIPMSFGNVFQSKEVVRSLLEVLYDEFQQLFPNLENKIEVGLKVIGKKDWLESKIQQNNQIGMIKQEIDRKSESASFYDRIKLGEMAKQFFDVLQEEALMDIFTPLTELAEASKENEVIGDRMLLNSAFLIDRNNEELFDKKVNELYEKYCERYEFNYTGPWPAYNFINIRLKVEKP
jgi:hypothetical protein